MAARPGWINQVKALWLSYRHTNGVHGRKLELDHLLGQYGINICLLTETHLKSGEAFRMENYVYHRTNRLTEGGGTPVHGLKHLETTAIRVMLASKPVKIMEVYLLPSQLLRASDLSASLGGGLCTLMAGDLNTKHVHWNSRLITTRGGLLHDYADENSCLIYAKVIIPGCYILK